MLPIFLHEKKQIQPSNVPFPGCRTHTQDIVREEEGPYRFPKRTLQQVVHVSHHVFTHMSCKRKRKRSWQNRKKEKRREEKRREEKRREEKRREEKRREEKRREEEEKRKRRGREEKRREEKRRDGTD